MEPTPAHPHPSPERVEVKICPQRRSEKIGPDRLAIRLDLPASTIDRVLRRHNLSRLDHPGWPERGAHPPLRTEQVRNRARRLASSLIELGEDVEATERRLTRWKVPPRTLQRGDGMGVEPPPPRATRLRTRRRGMTALAV